MMKDTARVLGAILDNDGFAALERESDELVRILSTIISKAKEP